MKLSYLLLACTFLSLGDCVSQSSSISNTFKNYIEELNDFNRTKNSDKVLKYLDPRYIYTETFIDLKGDSKFTAGNLSDYIDQIMDLGAKSNVEFNIDIEKLATVAEEKEYGVISAIISITVEIDGEMWAINRYSLMMTATRKQPDEWKFVHGNAIRKQERNMPGLCICNFYKKDEDFITELLYTIDFQERRVLDNFKFITRHNQRKIETGYKAYEWRQNGIIREIGMERSSIGAAEEKKDAMLAILLALHSEQCDEILTP